MPNPRVQITLSFATNTTHADGILLRILERLPATTRETLRHTDIHTFDLDDVDPDEPNVHAVVNPDRGHLSAVFTNAPDVADNLARSMNGVVVELPVIADYRQPAAAPGTAAEQLDER